MEERYYAIEKIGLLYAIKLVVRSGQYGPVTTYPLQHTVFPTELAARNFAERNHMDIRKVGDSYQII